MIDNVTTNEELVITIAQHAIRVTLISGGIFFTWHALRAYLRVLRWYWQDVFEMWVSKNMDVIGGKAAQKVIGRLESGSGRRIPYIVSSYVTITEARRKCGQWANNRFRRQWWLCFKRSMKGEKMS